MEGGFHQIRMGRFHSGAMIRKAWYFLGVTFAVTCSTEGLVLWWLGGVSALSEVGYGLGAILLLFVVCMYVPTLAEGLRAAMGGLPPVDGRPVLTSNRGDGTAL